MDGDTYFKEILGGSWTIPVPEIRDKRYLEYRLNFIWENHFKEVERKNEVVIRFKGKWQNKFGHIKLLKDKSTEIAINGFFKDERIPQFIIDLTIAHELVHYSHGFHSPHPKLYKYPHQGGIVSKSLKQRGFKEHLKNEKQWIKEIWKPLVEKEFKRRRVSLFRFF